MNSAKFLYAVKSEMVKKVFPKDIQDLLSEMKMELKSYGYAVKLIGGLHEKGYTSHDIDLDISMPFSIPPNEEIFHIVN